MIKRLAYLLFFILFIASPYSGYSFKGRADVINGDTLQMRSQRIRLHGIDALEKNQSCDLMGKSWRCGQQAAIALAGKIGRAPIRCEEKTRDLQMRVIAVCYLDNLDLGAWMVEQGWALANRPNSRHYVPQEERAKANLNGIWTSKFVMPWTWRAGKRGTKKQ